jgi:16S rRNA (guanine1516-N2)-methyltransferase
VNTLAVCASVPDLLEQAQALAVELALPLLEPELPGDPASLLQLCPDGLHLQAAGSGSLRVDFGAGKMRYRRRGGHNEPLGRAVGVGKRMDLRVVDATAGLGRDSFVLADLGCNVTMLERSPAAFALLRDGLQRAATSGDPWLQEVASRMRLHFVDSREWLACHPGSADVVYLDPMFPARKKSARVKKEMWLFQHLVGKAEDEQLLLEQAISTAAWRVVVKRPIRTNSLPGPRVHHTLSGKTVRYDVYNCGQAGG